MLAIAAGMWAMRPLRPYASVLRQALGWIISGAALGAATLTAGPTAGPAITFPMIVMVLLCPHRVTNLMGLAAAHAIAALVLVPWTLEVHGHNPDIWAVWLSQLYPADASLAALLEQTRHRTLIALVILLPWTIWLIGALGQPFSASSRGDRQRPFIGWGWFLATALVLIVLPQPRTIAGETAAAVGSLRANVTQMLLLIPVASVFVGQLFSQYTDLAGEGRYPRIWRMLRWPHLAMLVAGSVTAAALFALQPTLMDRNIVSEPFVSNPGPIFWVGIGVALLAIVAISARWAIKEFPARAVICWSLWAMVLAFVLWIPVSRSAAMQRSYLPSMLGPVTELDGGRSVGE
jgi:hypothetical protein